MGYHVDELEGLLHLSPGLMGGAPRRTTQRHIEGVADFMGGYTTNAIMSEDGLP